jgi:hypothetical protein
MTESLIYLQISTQLIARENIINNQHQESFKSYIFILVLFVFPIIVFIYH